MSQEMRASDLGRVADSHQGKSAYALRATARQPSPSAQRSRHTWPARSAGRAVARQGSRERRLAERKGFEPLVRFPVHTLSKRAPSTTRTSLRL